MYLVDSNLGMNPFNNPQLISSGPQESPSTVSDTDRKTHNQFGRKTLANERRKMLQSSSFAVLRQLLRVLATVVTVGSGCSLGECFSVCLLLHVS